MELEPAGRAWCLSGAISDHRPGTLRACLKPLPYLSTAPDGETSTPEGGTGAEWVGTALGDLYENPLDGAFRDLWPELCSEDTTWDAADAAAPHLTQIAAQLGYPASSEYLIVLGLVHTCGADQLPADLAPAYRQAIQAALDLVLDALSAWPPNHELRHLLSAVAAFRGQTGLASVLQNLDAIQEPCPACAEVVFPSELQGIIATERQTQ